MIWVMPEGGLCNRLRVVASSVLFAQAVGQRLGVHWLQTRDFNARFDSLFESTQLPFELREGRALSTAAKAWSRSHEWLSRLRGAVVLLHAQTEPGVFDLAEQVRRIGNRDVFIRTNSRLAWQRGMFDFFKLGAPAQAQLTGLLPRLNNSVGVHIRGTDNVRATVESTLQRFEALMQAELDARPDAQFFVATDEPNALSHLQRSLGSRVWEYPKRAYDRDDPIALIDALVDLYALANTHRLIGSYWSSFTDTAADIRGIDCVIARAGA